MFRSYYGVNRDLRSGSARENVTNHEVVSADTKALKKALKELDKLDFDNTEPENTKKIYNTIMSFVDTYNNTVGSSKDSSTKNISNKAGKLKDAVSDYRKKLDEIGITIKNNGKLSVDKSKLKTATLTKVSMVFGDDTGFTDAIAAVNKKIGRNVASETAEMADGFDAKA